MSIYTYQHYNWVLMGWIIGCTSTQLVLGCTYACMECYSCWIVNISSWLLKKFEDKIFEVKQKSSKSLKIGSLEFSGYMVIFSINTASFIGAVLFKYCTNNIDVVVLFSSAPLNSMTCHFTTLGTIVHYHITRARR